MNHKLWAMRNVQCTTSNVHWAQWNLSMNSVFDSCSFDFCLHHKIAWHYEIEERQKRKRIIGVQGRAHINKFNTVIDNLKRYYCLDLILGLRCLLKGCCFDLKKKKKKRKEDHKKWKEWKNNTKIAFARRNNEYRVSEHNN